MRIATVHIERWIARGLVRDPGTRDPGTADVGEFDAVDVARLRLLNELADDIGLDDDTVEAVVALIDQVHTLRGQLKLLAQAIAEQPPEMRAAVAAALQRLSRS